MSRFIVLAALAAGSLIPAAARAQSAGRVAGTDARKGFEDSWYWGAKGGMVRFGTVTEGRVSAPLAGGEWLVTHRRGALLVGAERFMLGGGAFGGHRIGHRSDPVAEARKVNIHDRCQTGRSSTSGPFPGTPGRRLARPTERSGASAKRQNVFTPLTGSMTE